MKGATLTMDGKDFYFASFDGEFYLGTSRPIHTGEEDLLTDLMAGTDGFKPMLLHERWLRRTARADGEVLEIVDL